MAPAHESEKRAVERIAILGELHGEVMVFQPMTIREISRGGAQVESSVSLQLNSIHQFRLQLGSRSVVASGRVAYCRISDINQADVVYSAGIEFVDRTPRFDFAIDEFINHLKQEREISSL
jgi:hypothetical protein